MIGSPQPCVVVFGGSFDPVHNGHVALANHFVDLFAPNILRVIPAGNPWQKRPLIATAEQRVEMVKRAWSHQNVPMVIDQQEIQRQTVTYTIDTLQSLRNELGPQACVIFLIGADQLQHLNTWKNWDQLLQYAHLGVATRPGFSIDAVPAEVMHLMKTHSATVQEILHSSCGFVYLEENLAIDISSTTIRHALRTAKNPQALLVPAAVLDYIAQHHLYQN